MDHRHGHRHDLRGGLMSLAIPSPGPPARAALERLAVTRSIGRPCTMRLWRDEKEVSAGSGAACLGHPAVAVAWLAATARSYGQPLRAGEIVLSGALGPVVPVRGVTASPLRSAGWARSRP